MPTTSEIGLPIAPTRSRRKASVRGTATTWTSTRNGASDCQGFRGRGRPRTASMRCSDRRSAPSLGRVCWETAPGERVAGSTHSREMVTSACRWARRCADSGRRHLVGQLTLQECHGILRRHLLNQNPARLDMPVWVGMAETSSMHGAEAAARVARAHVRDATVTLWPDTTHSLPMERPRQIDRALLDFMAAQEPNRSSER